MQPAFECCTYPKAGQNTFFSRFQPFLLILNLFQWFHNWNQEKMSENKTTYTCFFSILSTLQSWLTCKSWSIPWGGARKSSFFGWVCVSTSFWVHVAPESCSKYTTKVLHLQIIILYKLGFNEVSVDAIWITKIVETILF